MSTFFGRKIVRSKDLKADMYFKYLIHRDGRTFLAPDLLKFHSEFNGDTVLAWLVSSGELERWDDHNGFVLATVPEIAEGLGIHLMQIGEVREDEEIVRVKYTINEPATGRFEELGIFRITERGATYAIGQSLTRNRLDHFQSYDYCYLRRPRPVPPPAAPPLPPPPEPVRAPASSGRFIDLGYL